MTALAVGLLALGAVGGALISRLDEAPLVRRAMQTAPPPSAEAPSTGQEGGDLLSEVDVFLSPEAMRQRMAEAMMRSFADFRASLSAAQQSAWDGQLRALATARRGTVWKLVDGKPQAVAVRVGASDGTVTEVSGEIAEGDAVITGQERPAA